VSHDQLTPFSNINNFSELSKIILGPNPASSIFFPDNLNISLRKIITTCLIPVQTRPSLSSLDINWDEILQEQRKTSNKLTIDIWNEALEAQRKESKEIGINYIPWNKFLPFFCDGFGIILALYDSAIPSLRAFITDTSGNVTEEKFKAFIRLLGIPTDGETFVYAMNELLSKEWFRGIGCARDQAIELLNSTVAQGKIKTPFLVRYSSTLQQFVISFIRNDAPGRIQHQAVPENTGSLVDYIEEYVKQGQMIPLEVSEQYYIA